MNCELVRELLSLHLDGLLVDPDRQDLSRHLEECAGCREHFESLDQVVSLIHGIPPVCAPGGFRDAVQSGLSRRSVAKSLLLRMIPRVAAAVLLVTFGALGALHFLAAPSGPPVEVGLLGSDAAAPTLGEAPIRSASEESSPASPASAAEPLAPAGPAPGGHAAGGSGGGTVGIGGGAGGAFDGAVSVDLVSGTRSRSNSERSLEYVVSGGEPDATAGLILAELGNRRARTAGRGFRDTPVDDEHPAGLERVVPDDEGEPARLVLYLTADEVRYILTLLAKRNGATTVLGRSSRLDGDDSVLRAPPGKPEMAEGDAEGPGAEENRKPQEEKSTSAPHRFRVELRFDRKW